MRCFPDCASALHVRTFSSGYCEGHLRLAAENVLAALELERELIDDGMIEIAAALHDVIEEYINYHRPPADELITIHNAYPCVRLNHRGVSA